MIEKRWLGNIEVNVMSQHEALQAVSEKLQKKEKTDVFFLNDHCYNLAQQDKEYKKIINNSDLLLNDGIGVEIGAKIYGFQFKENMNGTDFIPALFEHLNKIKEQKFRIFLLGAKPGIAKAALDRLGAQYRYLEFVGEQHGYYDHNKSGDVIDTINQRQTDLLLVGFGMPLQEKWIAENRSQLNCTVTLAVGAFIDFSSGTVNRAPSIFRKLRLEWLYRMAKEPKRLWKRNLVGHFLFFYYMFKQRLSKKSKKHNKGA
ncbi:WecB/TagA/CpsF family glycosyltransferase [Niallia sp. NCCP-28]|uniref:WecB/TagA/CpsF family glycosyltransferase n=1 Tax=Niallia sp. NCCP-28 TaxID=2934712 RepID=UPI00208C3418|nr:WecB/TagA/CpsF family glycosyltransferase [Niallia sp. NCCP-28]GKU83436.1 UDP-N-acetyl-D-mannosaminuronic acid transferase [Niallia sp. NCCP-28]